MLLAIPYGKRALVFLTAMRQGFCLRSLPASQRISKVHLSWFGSIHFWIWLCGSFCGVVAMPCVAIFTRSDPLKVRPRRLSIDRRN